MRQAALKTSISLSRQIGGIWKEKKKPNKMNSIRREMEGRESEYQFSPILTQIGKDRGIHFPFPCNKSNPSNVGNISKENASGLFPSLPSSIAF